jgi:hypothetical protein
MASQQKAEAWEFGRLDPEDLEAADWTPIPFTLYGYDLETKEEHAFEFHARATQPFGATVDVMRKATDTGEIMGREAVGFLYDCLVQEDRDLWDEVVHRGPMHFEADALAQMAQKLIDFYNAGDGTRPPLPRSARRAGSRQRNGGGTSTVVHSGRVSTSARSR